VNDPKRPPLRWPRPAASPIDPLLPQPQPSRSRRTPDWRLWFSDNGPVQVRLVWSGRPGEIEGVRVWNVNTQRYSSVRPTESLAADVREAFAHFVAEDIVAAVWPASGTGVGPPASSAELLNVTEELLDPRLLVAEVIRVFVQIAAVHAGIPPFAARVMGQAAGDLFTELSSPDPDAPKVQAAQYVDFALSLEDGSLINSPALPQIATAETANAIDKLLSSDNLSPGARNRPSSPNKAIREPVGPNEPPTTPGPSHPVPSPSHPTSGPSHPAQGPSKPSPAEIDHRKPGGFEP
jgi:hypothetical protein